MTYSFRNIVTTAFTAAITARRNTGSRHLLAGLLTVLTAHPAQADDIHIAAAANFATPLRALTEDFRKRSGHNLLVSPEATGKLYAQIKNGAPFDVFLSADQTTPTRLGEEGNAVKSSQFTYGIGKLVLWSSNPATVDAKGEVLKSSLAKHMAIANPKTAPYGAAAVSVMESLGVYSSWQARLVQGENIAQTFQFVSTGNAELGFIAFSQVIKDGKIGIGSGWIVDGKLHAPLKQDVILLNTGKDKPGASAFLTYLKSNAAKTIINSYGYDTE